MQKLGVAKEFLMIVLGSVLYVIGTNLFLAPVHLYSIGIPGLSRQISDIINLIGINVGDITTIVYYLINLPIMIFSFKYLGKQFSIKTVLMIFLIGFFSKIIPTDIMLVDNSILAVIASAILMGTGLGWALNVGASTGGTDPIAIYFAMYKNKSVGLFNFLINGVIVLLAGIINTNFETIILMVMLLYVWQIVVDRIHNANSKITLMLVAQDVEEIREMLFNNSYRSCTYWQAVGGYEEKEKKMIMVTVSEAEHHHLIKLIKEIDDSIWINIIKSHDVVGNFSNYYQTSIIKIKG